MSYIPNTPLTHGTLVVAATTNATSIKASPGVLGFLAMDNTNSTPLYVKFYDKASAPTVGTDTPAYTFMVPGNLNGAGNNPPIPPGGLNFTAGIAMAVTTNRVSTDATAVGTANTCTVNYGYL